MPQLPNLLAADEFLLSWNQAARADDGTGPFEVASNADGVLTLAANESSWQGRPFVDAIELRTHRAISDQWLDLGAGRADMVEVPAEDIRQAQQQRLAIAVSAPVEVLALQITASNTLADLSLRTAIAFAIDRTTLANVIYQKQAKPAASLLPQNVSGYAFLFTAERNLDKARELRRGESAALSLAADGNGAVQLAAQRIVLNLREAGFNAQLAPASGRAPDLTLRTFLLDSGDPSSDLVQILRAAGEAAPAIGSEPEAAYNAEHEYLARRTLIPLVHLPRAYAIGGRVRNFQLRFDGMPELGMVSLEGAK
jgi:MarR-like DNA-binding transcriptional regulator SgrR of sgrS sRNA